MVTFSKRVYAKPLDKETEPKQKHPIVDVSGDGSKV